ncbi:DcrB-related protein [Myxococcus qinghaiensis]|uniref:DcrB-related protein n=1 Tax=Myxococcus qinghaiensis TaxID=2906758 RepID=UPI0020A790B6|nr:DcrB-related protein [Myxococcus qinghaiensis]MCP3163549.1 DUF1795 domain-containing protein [Myxococcus qinghaiensis]
MSTNTIRHGDLTLPLPEGWADASQVVAMGPVEEGFRASVVVSTEPRQGQETAKDLATRALAQLQRSTQGFALVSEKPAKFGGQQGLTREYTCLAGALKVAQLQFYCVKDKQAYTFTYTQRADRIAYTRAVAELFFGSVRIGA